MNKIDTAAYDGDVVSRLRNWRGLHLAHSGELFEEAATEIEVQRACTSAARDEIARLRLTKKERKAVTFAAEHFGAFKNQAATLWPRPITPSVPPGPRYPTDWPLVPSQAWA